MCYRALTWMPLWVVMLNFDVFWVSMTAQNNMARMPIKECKCELYFKIFIFSVFQRQPRTIWWECLYENAMWIVISNFDFFLYSNDSPEQYGENAYMRMPMWIVFSKFYFFFIPMTAHNNMARGHLWVAHIFDLSRTLNLNGCLLRQRIFSEDNTIPNNLSRVC